VPDFAALVRERLALPDVEPQREAEIRAELSAHLEDAYTDARAHGHTEEESVCLALAESSDWTELARRVNAATTEGGMMSHHMKSLWLPGLTMLGCSATFLLAVGWLFPGEWWANRDGGDEVAAATAAILLYVLLGALGAAWSRRVGGTWRERLGAGLLPIALHVAVVVSAILAGIFTEFQQHPEHTFNPQLRVVFVFVIVPAVALSTGAAPFLRASASADKA
jgi:hypothetical protein